MSQPTSNALNWGEIGFTVGLVVLTVTALLVVLPLAQSRAPSTQEEG